MIDQKTVSYAKEVDDVMALVVGLVRDVRQGKPVVDIISENIQPLINAIGGLDGVQSEIDGNFAVVAETVGYRVGDLVSALLKK